MIYCDICFICPYKDESLNKKAKEWSQNNDGVVYYYPCGGVYVPLNDRNRDYEFHKSDGCKLDILLRELKRIEEKEKSGEKK